MKTKQAIEWKKRARRNRAGSRTWESACGRYYVVAVEMVFGVKIRPVRYAVWWRYRVQDRARWFTSEKKIGQYASRKKAERAADKHKEREHSV